MPRCYACCQENCGNLRPKCTCACHGATPGDVDGQGGTDFPEAPSQNAGWFDVIRNMGGKEAVEVKWSCPNCEAHDVALIESRSDFSFDFAGVAISGTEPVTECTACDFIWRDNRAEEARTEAIIQGLAARTKELTVVVEGIIDRLTHPMAPCVRRTWQTRLRAALKGA